MTEGATAENGGSGWLSKVFIFVLGCCISLAVGKAFEFVTSVETYRSALVLQQRWYNSVDAMTPWTLASNYIADVTAFALRGDTDWTHSVSSRSGDKQTGQTENLSEKAVHCEALEDSPVSKPNPVQAATAVDGNALSLTAGTRDATCRYLNGLAGKSCLPGIGQVVCTTGEACSSTDPRIAECIAESDAARRQFDDQCQGWTQQQLGLSPAESNRMLQDLGQRPVPERNSGMGQKLLAPLVGIAAAWTRLTHDGGSSYFWAILQIVTGFAGFLVFYAWIGDDGSEGVWFWLIAVPIGTIVTASCLAFAVKYMMLGALAGFGWFTCFAGLCCGATGVMGFVWYCVINLTENGVQSAAAPK